MRKLIVAAALFAALPIMAENVDTVFSIEPQMSCKNCVAKIKNHLRFEKGVKAVHADLKTQTVTVTYDDKKTDPETLAAAFAEIGYEATPSSPSDSPARSAGFQPVTDDPSNR